jgi:hypothetical protein
MRILLFALVLLAGGATASAAPRNICPLLTPAEISAFWPGAKAGKPDFTREKYGITACDWDNDIGTFILQNWKSEGDSARDEIEALMIAVIDPMKSSAMANIRFETLAGVGDQAVAVVEVRDEKKSILNEAAMLITKRGDQVLMLAATNAARGDRAKVIAGLKSLAQKSLARL